MRLSCHWCIWLIGGVMACVCLPCADALEFAQDGASGVASKFRIPDDYIDARRYPLLAAREVMRQVVDDLLGRSTFAPGALA